MSRGYRPPGLVWPAFWIGMTVGMIIAALVYHASPACADIRPVNEGGDTRACMTPTEWEAVGLNMRRGKVERIVDSAGRRAPKRMLHYVDGLAETGGLEAQHAPASERDVRLYRICDQPDYYFGLVEYRLRHANPARDRVQSTYLSVRS